MDIYLEFIFELGIERETKFPILENSLFNNEIIDAISIDKIKDKTLKELIQTTEDRSIVVEKLNLWLSVPKYTFLFATYTFT